MEVLEHQQQSASLGRDPEQGQDRLEEAQLGLSRIAGFDQRGLDLHLGQQLGQLAAGGRAHP